MVMARTKNQPTKYERAQQRVVQIRGFYNHVAAYVIVNIVLFLVRDKFTFVLLSRRAIGNPGFLEWIDWNVFGTAIVWGIILIFHGIKVFNNLTLFGKAWEERQMKRFIEEDNETPKY